MAQETWAGGTITGGADATSFTLKPRGGYVPLADIPNAPKTVGMPSLAYPKMPDIRYGTVRPTVDMESRAKNLMQAPLPSSFEEAQNIRTNAAGKGEMAVGKAISSVGPEFQKSMINVAEELHRNQVNTLKSKNVMDGVRQDILLTQRDEERKGVRALPPDQWEAAYQKIDEKYNKMRGNNLGVGPESKALLDAAWNSRLAIGPIQLKNDQLAWQRNQDTQLVQTGFDHAIQEKRFDDAADFVDRGVRIGLWNQAMGDEMHGRINFAQGVANLDVAKATPALAQVAFDEAKGVLEGKPAKHFTVLNDHPGLAQNYMVEFRDIIKDNRAKGPKTIQAGIDDGTIKTADDIERVGKEAGMTDQQIELAKRLPRFMPAEFNPRAHTRLTFEINNFDPQTDNVPGHEGDKYSKLYYDIRANIDPEHQAEFMSWLNAKAKTGGKEPKEGVPVKVDAEAAIKQIEEDDKQGYIGPASERELRLSARVKDKGLKDELDKLAKKGDESASMLASILPSWFPGVDRGTPTSKAVKELLDDPRFKKTTEETAAQMKADKAVRDHTTKIKQYEKDHPDAESGKLTDDIFGKDSQHAKDLKANAQKAAQTPVKSAIAVPGSQTQEVTRNEAALQNSVSSPSYGQGRVAPRDMRAPNPTYAEVWSSSRETFDMRATAYTKHEPGGDITATRQGRLFTFEDYLAGAVPYVTGSMDANSPLQGKYLVNDKLKNVVVKVEDTGSAFTGKGNTAIDIAFSDRSKEKNYDLRAGWRVVSEEEAKRISGMGQGQASTGDNVDTHNVNPALLSKVNYLSQQFGGLKIISGFRSEQHNKDVKGAKNSEHLTGNAVDIDTSTWSNAQKIKLIVAAKAAGITGIGVYPHNIHLDLRSKPASWGHDYTHNTVPDWARPYVQDLINA